MVKEIVDIRHDLDRLPQEIEKAENDALTAKAELDYLNDMKKHLLAKEKEQHTGTNAHKETLAYGSEAYKTHLEGIKAAQQIYAEKSSRFHRLENEFQAARSLNKNIV